MKPEETIHNSIDELRSLLQDAERALANVGGEADEKIAELRDRMRNALAEGRSQFDHLRERTRDQLTYADEYIHAKPYQALGVAAAVGALIALLFARRGD